MTSSSRPSPPSSMPIKEIEAFLGEARNIMVAAIRQDGRPQMTPNWFLWQDDALYISTTKTRAKYRNLRRDPRVQLALDDPLSFRTVVIDGRAEILEDIDQFLPYVRAIRAKYSGQTADDAQLREGLVREQRVMLKITPDKSMDQWLSWRR